MLINPNQKYKLSNLAKELTSDGKEYKSKDLSELLVKNGFPAHNSSAVLENDEFNFLIDTLSSENQISDFDKYLNGESTISVSAVVADNTAPAIIAKPEPQLKPEIKDEPQNEIRTENKTEKMTEIINENKPVQQNNQPKTNTPQPINNQPKINPQPRSNFQPNNNQQVRNNTRPINNQQPRNNAQPSNSQNQKIETLPILNNNHLYQQNVRPTQQSSTQNAPRPMQPNGGTMPSSNTQSRPVQNAGASQSVSPRPPQGGVQTGNQTNAVDSRQRNARFDQKPQFNTPKSPRPPKPIQSRPSQPQMTRPVSSESNANPTVIDSQNRGSRLQGARVVDTRTSTVDLAKYDERLETLVPDAAKNAGSEKQKLKKQNTRQYSGEREKERIAMEKLKKQEAEKLKKQQLSVMIPDEIIVSELAQRLKVTAAEVIKKLMILGTMASVNEVIDYETAALAAMELGAKVTKEVVVTIEERLFDDAPDDSTDLVERAPVVCVMGHVDHGKTSLLDAIRHTSVTSGEAGGITQHIGAYRVEVKGKEITFLDTPGHEAFTAMRARGAQATDIAILVVAADDGIMPQTIEAINHAKAAGVDIIVAINKMDKYGVNPDTIKQTLTQYELVPEEWGGDVICVPVSALTHMGIDDLLENVLVVSEMKELKANPKRRAKGIVIEARLDKGRGPIATVLVQNGTLNNGDVVIAGTSVGRVRAMTDDKGKSVISAGPSVPVEIIGLAEVPAAGDEFNAVEDERMARELAEQRRSRQKENEFKSNAKVNLEDLFAQISDGQKDLNIIIKADVGGSAEAVKQSLTKLTNDEVKVNIIHTAVGGITEGDVMFASASNAIIVGFNVRPDKSAIDSAERQKVDIRTYRIIYECIEEIDAAMKGMLAPKFRESILGHIEVRQTIHIPSIGTIAGSYVQDGKIARNAQIRVLRDSIVIFEDKISSLRRFKDDVKEVAQGFECGVGLEHFNDLKIGDILEAFEMEEVK